MAHTQTASTRTSTKGAATRPKKPDTDLTEALEKTLAGEDEVVIYKNGKKVGAMISARAFKFLMKKVREEEDRLDLEDIRAAREEEGEIPWAQVQKEAGY